MPSSEPLCQKPSHLSPMTRSGAVAKEQRCCCSVVVAVVVLLVLVALVSGRALLGIEALLLLARVSSVYGDSGSRGGAFIVIVAGVRKLILQHHLQT